jgi:unsaturated rhamnogalacturonyl hydrolase
VALALSATVEVVLVYPFLMKSFRAFLMLVGLAVISSPSRAQDLPPAQAIIDRMRLVNGYFMREWPDPGKAIVTNQSRPSNIWTRGVYYEGLMALHAIDADAAEEAYAIAWGEAHQWGLRGGPSTRSADNQCCGQTYLELYQIDPRPERLREIKSSVDAMIASDKVDDWWWVDALQMSMPVFAKLGTIAHDPRYFEKMHALFLATRDGSRGSPALFNRRDGLWWRDRSFVPPYRDPNGADCYWSRGNGWVMEAMARVLEVIPNDAPGRDDYVQMLQAMAAAIKTVQRPDGFWNPSLHDAEHFAAKEESGTALFVAALASGIRLGLLPAAEYRPVVARAWTALATEAVHPDGFMGFVQGTGKQPSDSQPITYDRRPDFDDFGVGCFLLAGSEVARLASPAPVGK